MPVSVSTSLKYTRFEHFLIVSRVQEVFTYSNLYFVPGKTFEQGVDLLTRYRPRLSRLITNEFYSPSWLKPENKDRITVKVTEMKKLKTYLI